MSTKTMSASSLDAAQWAQETAIGPLGEQPDCQENAGVEKIRPGARELRGDRGLERLDLHACSRSVDLCHDQKEHDYGRDILAQPQALLERR